jgi:Ca2+-binding EF-hand superfamily protein
MMNNALPPTEMTDQRKSMNYYDLNPQLKYTQLGQTVQNNFDVNGETGLQADEFSSLVNDMAVSNGFQAPGEEQIQSLFDAVKGDDETVSTGELLDFAGQFDTDDQLGWSEEEYQSLLDTLFGAGDEGEDGPRKTQNRGGAPVGGAEGDSPSEGGGGGEAAGGGEAPAEAGGGEAPETSEFADSGQEGPDMQELFETLDANGNGELSIGELFDAINGADTDQDGSLNKDEFSALGETLGLDAERSEELFAGLDAADGKEDGHVGMDSLLDLALNGPGDGQTEAFDMDGNRSWNSEEFGGFAEFLMGKNAA